MFKNVFIRKRNLKMQLLMGFFLSVILYGIHTFKLQQMIKVAGSSNVKAVYTAEYHSAPDPTEKSGAHPPSPCM